MNNCSYEEVERGNRSMKNIKSNIIITMKPVDVVTTMSTKSVDAGMTMNMGVVTKRVIRMFNQMRSKKYMYIS